MSSKAWPSFDSSRLSKSTAAQYSSSESESDDEHLAPGVGPDDNDFGDFNPRKRRRLGGNNKEKAALGIFASDSDDDGPGKKWKRKTLRNKGMNFVSKGIQEEDNDTEINSGEEDEEDRPVLGNGNMDENESDDDDEEEEDGAPGIGLGFASAARGHDFSASGSSPGQDEPYKQASRPAFKPKFDGSSALGRGFIPSSENVPVLKEPRNGDSEPPRNKPQPSAFGAKGKINAKSFGARMMAKMGYVDGQGLGREGQGRNIVIEANLRPQGIGLGAVKEKSEQERNEEKRQARLRGETVIDSDEEEKKRKRARKKALGSAAGSAASTPRRQKKKYLTAEELKATAPGLHIPEALTPILDMTGPASKMLTSTSGIMTPTAGGPESADIIEARKLFKRGQADLLAFSEEWKALEERKSWANLELKEREQELEDMRSDFEKLQMFSNMISSELASATEWDQLISCLAKAVGIGSGHPEIADIAVAAIHPFLRDPSWDPLTEPDRWASDLKGLAGLLLQSGSDNQAMHKWDSSIVLADDVYRRHHKATTPYESMMYKNWLPRVLAAVRSWDPWEPAPMLSIMEHWSDLLPAFVRAQLMDNIARKLETALSDWNPRKKRQSQHLPHTWLFPWLQYLPPYHLDPKGTGLVADVKRKFRHLIGVWEFERGPVPGLRQWKDTLGDQWRPLIMAHVLPSMGKYLRTHFRIDPADQEPYLPILTGMLKWNEMLGEATMVEVLVQDMFPMWNDKLQEWLSLEEADLSEVADWYSWWRGVLLKDMSQKQGVSDAFDRGLQVLNLV